MGACWGFGARADSALVDLGQSVDAAGSYNFPEKDAILFKEQRSPMSAKSASHALKSGRSHVWMLLLATLAYVALTFHASFALASMAQTASPAAFSAWDEAVEILQPQSPGPLAPCCGEQRCATLVTAGPLVPTAHEPIAEFHYKARAVTVQYRAIIPTAIPGTPESSQNRRLHRHSPLYLSTARLRL